MQIYRIRPRYFGPRSFLHIWLRARWPLTALRCKWVSSKKQTNNRRENMERSFMQSGTEILYARCKIRVLFDRLRRVWVFLVYLFRSCSTWLIEINAGIKTCWVIVSGAKMNSLILLNFISLQFNGHFVVYQSIFLYRFERTYL